VDHCGQAMGEAGYCVKVVGHSLGAGAAALLAMMYRQKGIGGVSCYAFATPNCVSLSLAQGYSPPPFPAGLQTQR